MLVNDPAGILFNMQPFTNDDSFLRINREGVCSLSMISYRSVKMTSKYHSSYLEVRRKQKVNKPKGALGKASVSTSI